MYNILYYIFPPVTLYETIFPIPVDMAILIILDHLLVHLYSSFVPSVISLWNNLPDSVKTSSISVFKAHIYTTLASTAIYVDFVCRFST